MKAAVKDLGHGKPVPVLSLRVLKFGPGHYALAVQVITGSCLTLAEGTKQEMGALQRGLAKTLRGDFGPGLHLAEILARRIPDRLRSVKRAEVPQS